jgi:hypothetical protein
MNDGFGIRVSLEGVAVAFEERLDLLKVVNLTVEGDADEAVFAGNRLIPADEIDDRKASHSQCDTALDHHSLIVRATMPDDAAHAIEDRAPFR